MWSNYRAGSWWGSRYEDRDADLHTRDKDPVPKWDGKNPTLNLKPWLKSLAIWKHDTAIPSSKHGTKLFKSLEIGSDLRNAAEMVPLETLMSDSGWDAILEQIKLAYKAYLEMDLEIAVEEAIFQGDKHRHETFTQFVAKRTAKIRELDVALKNAEEGAMPSKVMGVILKRQSMMTDAQRQSFHSGRRARRTRM